VEGTRSAVTSGGGNDDFAVARYRVGKSDTTTTLESAPNPSPGPYDGLYTGVAEISVNPNFLCTVSVPVGGFSMSTAIEPVPPVSERTG